MSSALTRFETIVDAPASGGLGHGLLAALRRCFLPFALSRIAFFLVAWAANYALPYGRPQDPWQPAPARAWLSWDAVHYLRIAKDGYPSTAGAVDGGFFPLMPLLLRALGAQPLAALAFALLAGLAGVVVLTALTARLLGPAAAGRTAWVASWWPEAFVWSAVYTEGLFLALAAGALWAAGSRRALLAAVLGLGAGVLRPTGLLMAVPLLVMLPAGRARLAALAPVAGALGFAAFLWLHTGQPLAFLLSQTSNHHVAPGVPFLAGLVAGRAADRAEQLVGLAVLAGVVLAAARLWRMQELRQWRLAGVLTVAALLAPALLSGTLSSFGRYAMVAFPLFWAIQRMDLSRLAPAAIPAALAFTVASGSGRLTP